MSRKINQFALIHSLPLIITCVMTSLSFQSHTSQFRPGSINIVLEGVLKKIIAQYILGPACIPKKLNIAQTERFQEYLMNKWLDKQIFQDSLITATVERAMNSGITKASALWDIFRFPWSPESCFHSAGCDHLEFSWLSG